MQDPLSPPVSTVSSSELGASSLPLSPLLTNLFPSLRWLEFETVLGPEDDGEPKSKLAQLAAPAQNLLDNIMPNKNTEVEKPGFSGADEPQQVAAPALTDLAVQGKSFPARRSQKRLNFR